MITIYMIIPANTVFKINLILEGSIIFISHQGFKNNKIRKYYASSFTFNQVVFELIPGIKVKGFRKFVFIRKFYCL